MFGYGLVIPHYGTIVVGEDNQFGNYCVLHTSVCIAAHGKRGGDGLYVSTGTKITSALTLSDNVSIGAQSLVNKSFAESDIMLAGSPATIKKKMPAWYVRDGATYTRRVEAVERLRRQMGL